TVSTSPGAKGAGGSASALSRRARRSADAALAPSTQITRYRESASSEGRPTRCTSHTSARDDSASSTASSSATGVGDTERTTAGAAGITENAYRESPPGTRRSSVGRVTSETTAYHATRDPRGRPGRNAETVGGVAPVKNDTLWKVTPSSVV